MDCATNADQCNTFKGRTAKVGGRLDLVKLKM